MSGTPQLPAIAIHGGAGNLARYQGTGRIEEAQAFLGALIDTLHQDLKNGRSAMETVEEAVIQLEDKGFFHAGKGSSPSTNGRVELDASIMDGATLAAGGVALVKNVKNPIRLARAVLSKTPHVLLAGLDANELAKSIGLEHVEEDYFVPCDMIGGAIIGPDGPTSGTVGAVARDSDGHYAAATSTGGTLRKTAGRIGDTPIIGAGTYALDRVGAVSCTGQGEFFMRHVVAYQVVARMELLGESVGAAAGTVMQRVHDDKGEGGLIAIGPRGEVSMPFNTTGMYRAAIDAWGKRIVGVL